MKTKTRFRLAKLADYLMSTFIVVELLAGPTMLLGAISGRNTIGAYGAGAALAGIALGMLGVWASEKAYRQ